MSSSTLYQSAILQDDHAGPSTSTAVSTTHHHVKFTTAHPFTPKFVQDHLLLLNGDNENNNSHKARARARALYDERVRRRQLVLAERRGAREKARREKVKAKVKVNGKVEGKMGRREAAEKGIWRLRAEEARWDAFVPLHWLWMGYMSELLGLATIAPREKNDKSAPGIAMPQAAGMHAKLVKADFHGSIMTVRKSRNAALVGASGIVVQETENTFKVVTRKDKLKVLPKQGSVFAFAVPLYGSTEPSAAAAATAVSGAFGINSGTKNRSDSDGGGEAARTVLDEPHIEFELYGNQFCFRATDRAGRKFKHKETIEL